MKHVVALGFSAAALAGLTGCASSRTPHVSPAAAPVAIPADLPPSPTTWPTYPRFSQHSCWARPPLSNDSGLRMQVAPSYAPAPRAHPLAARAVVRRLLAGLGDRRYIRSITLVPAPRTVGESAHIYDGPGGHPPADALQAKILVRKMNTSRHPRPEQLLRSGIAQFEGEIVGGALRDDLCDAGGAPLVMWGVNGGGGFAESGVAVDQRFPNPSPAAFRKRVSLIGHRFGFTVVSLRLLRPRDIAPLLVVKTSRSRKAFVKEIPRIMDLLNPHTRAGRRSADTFESFFFAAEDARGPFTYTEGVNRGEQEGGEWAANRCLYPYPTLGSVVGGRSCS